MGLSRLSALSGIQDEQRFHSSLKCCPVFAKAHFWAEAEADERFVGYPRKQGSLKSLLCMTNVA